jgi:hypothetical protein
MQHWAAIVGAEQFASERLYAHDSLIIPAPGVAPTAGDPVLLVAAEALFGLGKVLAWHPQHESVTVGYTHRLLDDPLPSPVPPAGPGLVAVPPAVYEAAAAQVPASRRTDADRSEWFVSVTLPIEAPSRAEAVREFWTYVDKLGPQELPAYVWPRGDELAMQAFVLGTPTNDDPEDADE